jgi:tripartite-type tricarboxylate transporter receptor subunit TctC
VLKDFAPVVPLVFGSLILVGKRTLPAQTLSELITWLKANPNKASAGISTISLELLTVMLQKETGTHFTLVPYRGNGQAMQDLVAGQIDLLFNDPQALPLIRAGSIKEFAVTSEQRLALAPNIPTFAELGLPALSFSGWYGLFAPKGTPLDVVGKLNVAAAEALADQTVRSRLVDFGYEVVPREQQTSEALASLVKADASKWWPIIKEFAIRAE